MTVAKKTLISGALFVGSPKHELILTKINVNLVGYITAIHDKSLYIHIYFAFCIFYITII